MKGYKVVRSSFGGLVSCNMNFQDNSTLLLTYEVGEITVAPKGTLGIFVFLDLEDAQLFIRDGGNSSWKIYEAELLTKPVPRKEVLKSSKFVYLSQYLQDVIKEYQQAWKTRYTEDIAYTAPFGTYTVRKIRLLKKVY